MAIPKKTTRIYASRRHLVITIFFIVLPFAFLLVFSGFAEITTGRLFGDLFISTYRLLAAYIISVILAWVLAVLFYRGRKADVALPIFDVLQSFPTFAILPLATLFWGPSNFTLIFVLVVTVIWPILFSIISSLKLIKRDWEEAVAVAGLGGFNYIKYFLLPVTVPGLITGTIIGLGEGWEALVATEMIAKTEHGLGSFFQSFSMNPNITAFGILGLLILIFSINKLVWLPLLQWSHREMEE